MKHLMQNVSYPALQRCLL